MRTQLDEAAADSRGVLAELLDEYLRELAGHREIAAGAVDAAGYPHLDAYFAEPGRHAFLIRHGGEIAGFAMVRTPASTGSTASQMAEFYVRPEQRGRGVGRAAVAAIWQRFPGAWELQVHARNAAAVRFWEACIRAAVRRPAEKRVIEAADGRRFQLEFHVGDRQPPPVGPASQSGSPGRRTGGVILDMDGLMVDTEPLYERAWREAVRRLGYELTREVFRSFSGRTDADSEAALRAALGPRFPLREFQASWPQLWHEEARAHGVPTRPGIPRLLAALREQRVPRAVATSSPRARAELALREAGIDECFSVVVACDDVRRGKPAPDLFLEAARRLGLPPPACVVLEDSDAGARAAAAAGMRVIVVPDRHEPSHEVRRLAAGVHATAEEALPVLLELLALRAGLP